MIERRLASANNRYGAKHPTKLVLSEQAYEVRGRRRVSNDTEVCSHSRSRACVPGGGRRVLILTLAGADGASGMPCTSG